MKSTYIVQTYVVILVLALSAYAQTKAKFKVSDSLAVPKNFENYNEFQIEKWGPVTYSGTGKCDILDLYQRSVELGLGYSTVVDYHYKQTKVKDTYSCESWGLGLSFKVVVDSNKYSEVYALEGNIQTPFSSQKIDPVKKFFESEAAFLEVKSITPITFQTVGDCHKVDFLFNKANETSGFHGIIDIKSDESMVEGESVCTFWGLGVEYKRREIVEKVVTKKRVVEIIKTPPVRDTVFVPQPVKPAENCCLPCCCNH